MIRHKSIGVVKFSSILIPLVTFTFCHPLQKVYFGCVLIMTSNFSHLRPLPVKTFFLGLKTFMPFSLAYLKTTSSFFFFYLLSPSLSFPICNTFIINLVGISFKSSFLRFFLFALSPFLLIPS